jgi:hypothetical protein
MSTLILGECMPDNIYSLLDPDGLNETEVEYATVKALNCLYLEYRCFVFTGSFFHEGRYFRPDLALVARDLSHWFVIEIELLSHSFDEHVLPQVKALLSGIPQQDCVTILSRELSRPRTEIETFLRYVPRATAVVLNKENRDWLLVLNALNIQTLTLRLFQTANGTIASELLGRLISIERSLGFGTYSAVDRSVRFPRGVGLPAGPLEILEPGGALSFWKAVPNERDLWLMKEHGVPAYQEGIIVQLLKSRDGRLVFRLPRFDGMAQSR